VEGPLTTQQMMDLPESACFGIQEYWKIALIGVLPVLKFGSLPFFIESVCCRDPAGLWSYP